MRVGFVGLGSIGKPMALRLVRSIRAEDELWVFDVAAAPVAELVAGGAHAASSVADLAARVDVLCVMVRDDDQVRAVVDEASATGARAARAAGTAGASGTAGAAGTAGGARTAGGAPVIVVHSTVAPGTPAELAVAGHRVIDAPVSGGAMGAAEGTLAILVGGAEDDVALARPMLERMGSLVVHAGPIGAGTRMKLARNLLHFVAFTAATEAQRLAEASQLDLVALGNVVRHTDAITGGPGAILHRKTTAELEPGDFWTGVFGHVAALGEKDLKFAIELAGDVGVEVPLAQLALEGLRPGLGLPAEVTR